MLLTLSLLFAFSSVAFSNTCTCDRTTTSCSYTDPLGTSSCTGCTTSGGTCLCASGEPYAHPSSTVTCQITASCSTAADCQTYAYGNLSLGQPACVDGQCTAFTCGGSSSQSPFGTNCPSPLSYCNGTGSCKSIVTTTISPVTPATTPPLPRAATAGTYGCGNPTFSFTCCEPSSVNCLTYTATPGTNGVWIQYVPTNIIGIWLAPYDAGTHGTLDFTCSITDGFYCIQAGESAPSFGGPISGQPGYGGSYACSRLSGTIRQYFHHYTVSGPNTGALCVSPGTSTAGYCSGTLGGQNVGICQHVCTGSTWNEDATGGCTGGEQCNHVSTSTGTCLRPCNGMYDLPTAHAGCKYSLNSTQIINGNCNTSNLCDYNCNGVHSSYPFGNGGCPSGGGTIPQICDGVLGKCVYPITYNTLVSTNGTYNSTCDVTIGGVLLRSSIFDAARGCLWIVNGIVSTSPSTNAACPSNGFVDNGACAYFSCNGSPPIANGTFTAYCTNTIQGRNFVGRCLADSGCTWVCNGRSASTANDTLLCGSGYVCENINSTEGICESKCGDTWSAFNQTNAECSRGLCVGGSCYSKCNDVVWTGGPVNTGCNGTGICNMAVVNAGGNGICNFVCNGWTTTSPTASNGGCRANATASFSCQCLGSDICQCTCRGIAVNGTAYEASYAHPGCAAVNGGNCDGSGYCWSQCGSPGVWSRDFWPNVGCLGSRYLGKSLSTCRTIGNPLVALTYTQLNASYMSLVWPYSTMQDNCLEYISAGSTRVWRMVLSDISASNADDNFGTYTIGSCAYGQCGTYEPYSTPQFSIGTSYMTRTNRFQYAVFVNQPGSPYDPAVRNSNQAKVRGSRYYPSLPEGVDCNVLNQTVYGTLVGDTYLYSCKYFCNDEVSDTATNHPGCSGRGTCTSGDTVPNYGVCTCYNFLGTTYALYGADCSIPISTTNCSLHGAVASIQGEVLCQCDAGYAGWDCHLCSEGYYRDASHLCVEAPACTYQVLYTPLADNTTYVATCTSSEVCSTPCGAHAWCSMNNTQQISCQCEDGFYMREGVCTELLMCGGLFQFDPNVCNGRGTCDYSGVCTCRFGWTGANCEAAPCAGVDCGTYGRCMINTDDLAECVCNTGWDFDQSDLCTVPICNPACAHGVCTGPGVCDCSQASPEFAGPWTGATCEIPDCGPTCDLGYARCDGSTGNATCICLDGFTGPECRTADCPSGCSGDHKICRFYESCECLPDLYYNDTNTGICQPVCGNCNDLNAQCVSPGNCTCNPGYELVGGICTPICSTPCTPEQNCSGPNHCECKPGYADFGAGCVSNCSSVCGAHQACVTHGTGVSECVCLDGYSLDADVCVPLCSACRANSHCVAPPTTCVCNTGYQDQNGVCEPVCSDCLAATEGIRESCVTQFGCQTNNTAECNADALNCMCVELAQAWGWDCSTVASCYLQLVACLAEPDPNMAACGAAFESCNPADNPEYQCIVNAELVLTIPYFNPCARKLHSECTAPMTCGCAPGWSGEFCNIPSCVDLCVNSQSVWCNNTQGTVTCAPCLPGWSGLTCDVPDCSSCPLHSSCDEPARCYCDAGYYFEEQNQQCELIYHCNGIRADNATTCSGHGDCITTNNCSCEHGYSGADCENVMTCDGVAWNDGGVCGGHGFCVAEETCVCISGWIGTFCGTLDTALTDCQASLDTCSGNLGTCNVDLAACQSSCDNGLVACQDLLNSSRASLLSCNTSLNSIYQNLTSCLGRNCSACPICASAVCPPDQPYFVGGICWSTKSHHPGCRANDPNDEDQLLDGDFDDLLNMCVYTCGGVQTPRGKKNSACLAIVEYPDMTRYYDGICLGNNICKYSFGQVGKNALLDISGITTNGFTSSVHSGFLPGNTTRTMQFTVRFEDFGESLDVLIWLQEINNFSLCSNATFVIMSEAAVAAATTGWVGFGVASLAAIVVSVLSVTACCFSAERKWLSKLRKRKAYKAL